MLAGHIFIVSVLLTSSVLCLEVNRNFSVEYHGDTDAITVEINTKLFDYYHVELSMNGCSVKNRTILKQDVYNSHEVPKMDFYGPFKSSLYCVLITPSTMPNKIECQTLCQPVFHELNISSQDNLHCKEWFLTTNTAPQRNHDGTYQLRVTMIVERPFQSCFTSIIVSLWYGAYKKCDSVSGKEEVNKTVNVAPDLQFRAVFSDLKPGNYCTRIHAFHSSCGGPCEVRRTNVLDLPNITTSEYTGHFSSTANTEGSSLIYILVGCVVFIVIIVAAVSTCYCKRLHTHLPIAVNEKGLTLTGLIDLAKNRAQSLEIVLLYSQDPAGHSDVMLALYRFLLNGFGVGSVRFDQEEEAAISVNLHSWVEDILLPKPNRVFLVVESEGVVLQEDGRRRLRLVRPESEDLLDDVLPYALQLLKNGTRALCDYRTVFVVKFGYTSDAHRLNCIIPNRRYTLPKHLFELYCTLLDLPKPSSVEVMKSFEGKMIKEWQGPFLEDLISKIGDASQIISNNKSIIMDYFVEQDLFAFV